MAAEPSAQQPSVGASQTDERRTTFAIEVRGLALKPSGGATDGEDVVASLSHYVDEHSPAIAIVLGEDGTILHVSRSVERIAGLTPAELVGTSAFDLIHPDDVAYALGGLAEAAEHPGSHSRIELLLRTGDGRWLPVEVESYNPPDDPLHFVLVLRVVSDRTSMPERRLAFEHFVLRLAERCSSATAEGLIDAVESIAAELGELLGADEVRLLSIAPDRGRLSRTHWRRAGVEARLDEWDEPAAVEEFVARFGAAGRVVETTPSGPEQRGRGDVVATLDQPVVNHGEVTGLLSIAWHSAVAREHWDGGNGALLEAAARILVGTIRRALRVRTLSYQAMHDSLTGLSNRMRLFSALDHELNRSSGRHESRLAVAFCDLDGFKAVNDDHGHSAGDEVLVAVAHRLRGAVRSGDLVCRVGGDEFVVLCPEVETEREAHDIARRMATTMERPIRVGGGTELQVGASVGVVVVRGHGRGRPTADEVIRRADRAMYEAKHSADKHICMVLLDMARPDDVHALGS
jgi:diguanylate cyclase (GGDEF)-like protein/PAS domain S-box-containing protein